MKRLIASVMLLIVVLAMRPTVVRADDIEYDPRCEQLSFKLLGPFVHLSDGGIMCIRGNGMQITRDDGETWSDSKPLYTGSGPGIPGGGTAIRTREGAIVVVYLDHSTFKWGWDKEKGEAVPDARLDAWSIRSLDEGKTWTDRQMVMDGYCGALFDMIETSTGRLVVPIQDLFRNPGRHEIRSYHSDDQGKTWQHTQIIDLGGQGHHDGALEPTLVELTDGRLWMLIRTNWDYFWSAYSKDMGNSWRVLQPSPIDASSAPGFMTRLDSGRLVLAWNRLKPEGVAEAKRRGGQGVLSAEPASWHREELSLAFSDNDGKTWTKPAVIAERAGGGLSYPYIFEARPGELWIVTRFSKHVYLKVKEADFVKP